MRALSPIVIAGAVASRQTYICNKTCVIFVAHKDQIIPFFDQQLKKNNKLLSAATQRAMLCLQ